MAKPTASATISTTSTLAQGLVSAIPCREGSGSTAKDFTNLTRTHAIGAWTTFGGDTYARGTTTAIAQTLPLFNSIVTPAFSWASRVLMGPLTSSNSYFLNLTPADNSYVAARVGHNNGSTKLVAQYSNFAGTLTSSTDLVNGSAFDIALTWDATTLKLYVANAVEASATPAYLGGRSSYTNAYSVASPGGGSGAPYAAFAYMWNRAISSTEVADVFASPYSFFVDGSSPSGLVSPFSSPLIRGVN